jgi:hypothetical protein
MKPLPTFLTCCLLLAALVPQQGVGFGKRVPKGQVTVSKAASSLPGRTYAWVDMPATQAAEFDQRVQDPALRQRLQDALDKALAAKGYVRTPMAQADLAVAYRVGVRDTRESIVHEGIGGAGASAVRCSGGDCSQIVMPGETGLATVAIETQDLIEGGLMVEVLKPNEIRVLWRALFKGQIQARDRGTVDLEAVATKTLAKLPKAPAVAGAP